VQVSVAPRNRAWCMILKPYQQKQENKMAQDVVVKPGETYVITDRNRSLGTVTIQPGGMVSIETSAQVTIEKLIKQ
jgi:hypothetical protein